MSSEQPGDPARIRFLALQLIRISGVVMALIGLVILAGKTDLPQLAGWVLLVIGMLDCLVVPQILVRRWKSPRP